LFGQPILWSSGAPLDSVFYSKQYDSYLGTTAWMVRGKQSFWGSDHVSITGRATSATNTWGYFHAGSGTGNWIDANAILYVSSSS